MTRRRFGPSLLAGLLLIAPVTAAPFHHSFGEWREYNADWLAACPDAINESDTSSYYGTSCFASTGTVERNDANLPAYSMTLILDRLNGDLDITFTAAPTDGTEIDADRPLEIRFGGKEPMLFTFGSDIETRYNTINQYFVADAAKRQALLDTMRARNAATLVIPVAGEGEDATREIWLSMRGVLASIDFMTTYARRVGDYD